MDKYRSLVFNILQISFKSNGNHLRLVVNLALAGLILLNTIAIILHTVPALHKNYDHLFLDFEVFSVVIFSIEYILRVWSIVESPDYKEPVKGRLKFIFSS